MFALLTAVRYAAEVGRVLRPGGFFVMVTGHSLVRLALQRGVFREAGLGVVDEHVVARSGPSTTLAVVMCKGSNCCVSGDDAVGQGGDASRRRVAGGGQEGGADGAADGAGDGASGAMRAEPCG